MKRFFAFGVNHTNNGSALIQPFVPGVNGMPSRDSIDEVKADVYSFLTSNPSWANANFYIVDSKVNTIVSSLCKIPSSLPWVDR